MKSKSLATDTREALSVVLLESDKYVVNSVARRISRNASGACLIIASNQCFRSGLVLLHGDTKLLVVLDTTHTPHNNIMSKLVSLCKFCKETDELPFHLQESVQ